MIGLGNDCLMPHYIKQDTNKFLFKKSLSAHSPYLRVACDHCINCKINRSRDWSLRLSMEAKMHKDSCFITLTYNDDNLPVTYINPDKFYLKAKELNRYEVYKPFIPTCAPDDISAFVKRLRKHLGTSEKFRFFGVCEYGTRFGRPHNHILIFGLPASRETVEAVEKSWKNGFVRVDPFYGEGTINYISGYVMKKLYAYDENEPLLWSFRMREQSRQSLHLGEEWFFSHLKELQISNKHPYIDYQGYKYRIPRTFHRKLVRMGVLFPMSLDSMLQNQSAEYIRLMQFCEDNNTNLSEYFANRRKIALKKYERKTYKRNLTGDI